MSKVTIIHPDKRSKNEQGNWMRRNLPIQEINDCNIKVGIMSTLADQNNPKHEWQCLILPSGKILRIASDPEVNGPGCLINVEKVAK